MLQNFGGNYRPQSVPIKEVNLNKTLFSLAFLSLALASGSVFAQSGDWTISGSIVYADDDPDRAVQDDFAGLQFQVGYDLTESLTVEGLLGYNDWESFLDTPTARYPDWFMIDLSANLLWFPKRDQTFAPTIR